MVIGQGIARLVTGKTSVTDVGKEVILEEVVLTVLKVSGVDGVTQDHHLLDAVEAGVEVTAGDVATVGPDLPPGEVGAVLYTRDQ